MEAHSDETMNYLLPDDRENSLHIADSSQENQVNDNQDGKLESGEIVLSLSSNSEPPPAMEISNVEESILMKISNDNQVSECLKPENLAESQVLEHKPSYEYHDEKSLELNESKPPNLLIDLPNMQQKNKLFSECDSPKSELIFAHKKRICDKTFGMPTRPDAINSNEDTDDECNSDLTENQLTHFEDIRNDTANSKDDNQHFSQDEKDKLFHPERNNHESRHISAHDKVSSTSTIKPHAVCQLHPSAHSSSAIHKLSPHFASPPECIKDSPIFSMDAKSEQKRINDLSKIVRETKRAKKKSLHSVKPGGSKKDKLIQPERDYHESHHISAHDKVPSILTIKPHAVCLLHPSEHSSSAIDQLSPHLASPHEHITDSPIVVSNPYAIGQVRVHPIPICGQEHEDNKPESLSLSSHHYKSDHTYTKQPMPSVAHQTLPNIPYHSQGVLPGTIHIDGQASNPAHSPSSHIYKKDSIHNQQMLSLQNPATFKRPKSEHSSNEELSRTHLSHQGSSTSPGPSGMAPAHSPLPWHMTPNSHPSTSLSPHDILSTNEQSNSRINPHNIASKHSSDVRVHAQPPQIPHPSPPPDHTIPQASVPRTVPALSAHQCTNLDDLTFIAWNHPIKWQGRLALKNAEAIVQMHFVAGDPDIPDAALPFISEDIEGPLVKISHIMSLNPEQLNGVFRKILTNEHCILLGMACGLNGDHYVQQINTLKIEFINFLLSKSAAGIVNIPPVNQQPEFVIHIFPSCEFIRNNFSGISPYLFHLVQEQIHIVIIISAVSPTENVIWR